MVLGKIHMDKIRLIYFSFSLWFYINAWNEEKNILFLLYQYITKDLMHFIFFVSLWCSRWQELYEFRYTLITQVYLGLKLTHWPLDDVTVSFNADFHTYFVIFFDFSCEIAQKWNNWVLNQIMALYHLAPSHYLHQHWPRSIMFKGAARVQWVSKLSDT